MTSVIERARTSKPVTWLTLIGVLILPALGAGLFMTALHNPTERLESLTAAIVNLDEPVTIDGQYIPIGRQLAAGLVAGSEELDSNITWVISNAEDAAAGLADGRYAATVTIPAEFSAAATSPGRTLGGEPVTPERAQIFVETATDGKLADELILSQLTTVATATIGDWLTEATLANLLGGFGELGQQLGTAAGGANQLAEGAETAAEGAGALADGVARLGGAARQLSTGAKDLSKGTSQLAAGLNQMANEVSQIIDIPDELVTGLHLLADNATAIQDSLDGVSDDLSQLSTECLSSGASADFCARLTAATSGATAILPQMSNAIAQSRTLVDAVDDLVLLGPALTSAIQQSADAATQLAGGMSSLANGANALANGAASASQGAADLASGIQSLSDGVGELADGLATAGDAIPAFSEEEASDLVSVINNPITIEGTDNALAVPGAIPLLAAAALWFGSLATFIVLRPTPWRALVSRASTVRLAARSFLPAAGVGAAQGLLVALIAQFFAGYSAADWWAFAAVAVLSGVVFAAINQALMGVLAGFGRWISAVAGVLAVATGLVSTSPAWLLQIGALLPTWAASSALLHPTLGSIATLVVWGVIAFAATTIVVLTRRSTSYGSLVEASTGARV